MDRFEELLMHLGDILNVQLLPDLHRACTLNINGQLHIQLQIDEAKDSLLIASFLCDVSPGKFRENVLKEALKANGAYPRVGTLGFSSRKNKLALFEYLPLPGLKAEKVADFLAQFIEKCELWRLSVESGSTPPPGLAPTHTNRSIFNTPQ
jgi:hypothetical protein